MSGSGMWVRVDTGMPFRVYVSFARPHASLQMNPPGGPSGPAFGAPMVKSMLPK